MIFTIKIFESSDFIKSNNFKFIRDSISNFFYPHKFIYLVLGCVGILISSIQIEASEVKSVAKNVFITNYNTGELLLSKNADEPIQPASMAKIMTVFVAFQYIANKKLQMDDQFVVSEKAWRRGGSRTFLEVGSKVSVRDILHGIIVQSGNDAAIALAEGISGSEDAFVDEMNLWAKQIGMRNTNFRNSTGWPDRELTTTARDLNILATELIRRFPLDKHPELFPIFAKKAFTYNAIKQPNGNPLLYNNNGGDGLKTGYTSESGYGIVGSAKKYGHRVVMVLSGMNSKKERAIESYRLMDFYLRQLQARKQPAKESKLDRSKSICKEIGFTSGTEKFGDCVLKMMDN